MEASDQQNAAVVDFVRNALEPHGWAVVRHEPPTPGWTGVHLSHPLSAGHGVNWPNEHPSPLAFVTEILGHREFTIIATRPREMPHVSLVGRIRSAARANRWDHEVIAIVARLLRHEGLLTDAEAAWLEDAGPAWGELEPTRGENV